jgi:hypothetical protein
MHQRIEAINCYEDLSSFVWDHESALISLMRGDNIQESLELTTDLNCGAITHILGGALLRELAHPPEVFRIDGVGEGVTKHGNHIILGLKSNPGFFFVDGTIWQVNPQAQHMEVIGPFETEEDLVQTVQSFYGGQWSINRNLNQLFSKESNLIDRQSIAHRAEQRLRILDRLAR